MNTDRFKYRVWDNGNDEYINESFPASIYSDGHLDCFEEKYDAMLNEMVGVQIPNNRLIIEQCTGLKDEKGKLIYEGDKIRMTEFYFDGCGESERNFVGYVMWNNGEFIISQNPKKPEYNDETDVFPHLSWGHAFEVIGNIHDMEE